MTAVAPWCDRGGFALRAGRLLESLTATWDVCLVCGDPREPVAAPWPPGGPHRVVLAPTAEPLEAVTRAHHHLAPLRRAVGKAVEEWRPAALLLMPGTELLAAEGNVPPVVIDRVDCATLVTLRALKRWPQRLLPVVGAARYERRVLRFARHAIVAGADDARVLARLAGRVPVSVVPNGVDAAPSCCFDAESPVPTVAFSGTLDYPPNTDAIRRFGRAIWPSIRRQVPDARLLVAGRRPTPAVAALGTLVGVEIRADVRDMPSVLREAWVSVAPMRLGAGIKNKVLEAWAVGRPVVMTAVAANGLALDRDQRELIAEGPERIAELVVELLRDRDRRHRLGESAHQAARTRHSWGECGEAVSRVLALASGPA
ncbi:MAG: glycosyltransferase [Gemmatimonadales bacterium]